MGIYYSESAIQLFLACSSHVVDKVFHTTDIKINEQETNCFEAGLYSAIFSVLITFSFAAELEDLRRRQIERLNIKRKIRVADTFLGEFRKENQKTTYVCYVSLFPCISGQSTRLTPYKLCIVNYRGPILSFEK
jgi:hypothetical protein